MDKLTEKYREEGYDVHLDLPTAIVENGYIVLRQQFLIRFVGEEKVEMYVVGKKVGACEVWYGPTTQGILKGMAAISGPVFGELKGEIRGLQEVLELVSQGYSPEEAMDCLFERAEMEAETEVLHDWDEEYLIPGGELESQYLFSRYHRLDSEENARWHSKMEAELTRVQERKEAEKRAMEEEWERGGGKNWEEEWELKQWKVRDALGEMQEARKDVELPSLPEPHEIPHAGWGRSWEEENYRELEEMAVLEGQRQREVWGWRVPQWGNRAEEWGISQWEVPIGEVKVWGMRGTEGAVEWRRERGLSGVRGQFDEREECLYLWGKKHGDYGWMRFREGGDIMSCIGEFVRPIIF